MGQKKMEKGKAVAVIHGLKEGDIIATPVYRDAITGENLKELSNWVLRITVRDLADIELYMPKGK
nr:MAG TPA: hypothetical protein [Caudoviricetes sp.]